MPMNPEKTVHEARKTRGYEIAEPAETRSSGLGLSLLVARNQVMHAERGLSTVIARKTEA